LHSEKTGSRNSVPDDVSQKSGPTSSHDLPSALDAAYHEIHTSSAGRLGYYASTERAGRPLVLLHSINAAPSAIEMRPLFDHYRSKRPVYALDLPGFGRSERRNRPYKPTLYASALNEFLDAAVDRPADIVACSLSAEFSARAALLVPDHYASLTLISPTGLSIRRPPSGKSTDRILTIGRWPWLGSALFNLLTTKLSIGYFFARSFAGKVPKDLIDYAHTTARQPDAKHAPFYFLSMKMFTQDAFETLYRPLQLPVLVVYDRDPHIGFDRLDEMLNARSNWQAARIERTFGLPHWECLQPTIEAMDTFWQESAS